MRLKQDGYQGDSVAVKRLRNQGVCGELLEFIEGGQTEG